MTVAFMKRLPRDRQERVFEVWLNLHRDPTGGYSGESIADAMINSIKERRENGFGADSGPDSPQWYRRYRLHARRRSRQRSAAATREAVKRAIRKAAA